MSINPARTAASALPSGVWTAGWIYFVAPILGMFLAAQLYRGASDSSRLACPKLHHGTRQRCIFCGHPGARTSVRFTAVESESLDRLRNPPTVQH
jgi:aquaporin Z